LWAQAPTGVQLAQGAGLTIHGRRTFFVPDLCVLPSAGFHKEADYLDQDDVLLAIEMLSPANPGNDLVLKRHYYASGGIPQYWIVDPEACRLTVLVLDGESYRDRAVVESGQVWQSDQPFPLTIEPADFL
jgi:Uma2 family endonuclease